MQLSLGEVRDGSVATHPPHGVESALRPKLTSLVVRASTGREDGDRCGLRDPLALPARGVFRVPRALRGRRSWASPLFSVKPDPANGQCGILPMPRSHCVKQGTLISTE